MGQFPAANQPFQDNPLISKNLLPTIDLPVKEAKMSKPEEMWQCQTANCGYIYDPARGDKKGKIPPGTRFEDLPDDWRCPCCGVSKKMFRPLAGPGSAAEKAVVCAE